MAMVRMFWTPTVCWVQPMAYMMVPALPVRPVADRSRRPVFRSSTGRAGDVGDLLRGVAGVSAS